jgi:hypothetical protein
MEQFLSDWLKAQLQEKPAAPTLGRQKTESQSKAPYAVTAINKYPLMLRGDICLWL